MNGNLGRPSQETILIVDSSLDDSNSLSELLTQHSYRVRVAHGGAIALNTVRESPVDLILLDIQLPDLNGYEVCQQLKALPHTREVPVIFISAIDRVLNKVKAFAVGGRDYITKPFEIDEVLVRIQNQLSIRNALNLLTAQNALFVEELRERQRIERELRQSEEKFSKVFRSSPSAITITRLSDGCHVEVNETFCEVTGYMLEEIIGRTAQELNLWVDSEDRTDLFKMLTMYGVVRNYEFQFRTKTGVNRTALLSAEIININGQECLLSLSNDITDRVQAEQALKTANQELQRLATLDPLTEAANRRSFNEYLDQEWRRMKQEKDYISLILCDVDYFKNYNDCYGHLAGDRCLQQMVQVIQETLKRPGDFLARYGGEEFAIILPSTNLETAINIAEEIRQKVEKLKISHYRSQVSEYITLSLGVVSTIPTTEFSIEALIGVTDLVLYQAKEQGRNRVVAESF